MAVQVDSLGTGGHTSTSIEKLVRVAAAGEQSNTGYCLPPMAARAIGQNGGGMVAAGRR